MLNNRIINYKKMIKSIIIILSINPLRVETFFKCCDEEAVTVKNRSNPIENLTHSSPVTSNTSIQDSNLHNKYQTNSLTTESVNSTVTTFLAKKFTNSPHNSKKTDLEQLTTTKKSIFTNLDLKKIEQFFIQIDSILTTEKSLFQRSVEDRFNENELMYVRKKNYLKLFEKHLPFISQKFINFVHQNLDTPNLKQITKEQIIILDEFLSRFNNLTTFDSHYILTEWLEQITEDEIKEKNITLTYMPHYIEESIIPQIPQKDFKKEKIYEYKKLLVEKIMKSNTQSEESSNKQKAIRILIDKNPNFIDVIEDIFVNLFLAKISLNDSKPSAQAQEDIPHVPPF